MFLKKVQANKVSDKDWNSHFTLNAKTPEQMGLPAIQVKSMGTVVYSPRFAKDSNYGLVIQFGHYYGRGTYNYDIISKSTHGLNLYGGDNSPNNSIDDSEMKKLAAWMTKNEDAVKESLGIEVTAAIEITLSGTNLIFYGMGMDTNGNTVAKFGFPNQPKFSIKTNDNMPLTHKLDGSDSGTFTNNVKIIKKEVINYIKKYGTEKQKSSLKEYSEAAIKVPAKGTPEWHQHKIAIDTVKNPAKALMSGPSVDEAKKMLKDHFGYSDKDLEGFEVSAMDEVDDDSFECEKCHKIFDIEDSVKDSKKGEMYCPDCAEKEVKAAEDAGYTFNTPEEQVAALTKFYNDQGKWQEDYFEHEDYASGYDHLINETQINTHAMGEDFKAIWESIPTAHQKDAWHWVKENTKATFNYSGSPGNADPTAAYSLPHGGDEEVQVSGISGKVNGAETNDVLKWLSDGLTSDQLKKAQSDSDYSVHNDLLYVNASYSIINFPVDLGEFQAWLDETYGKTVESKVAERNHDMLIHLAKCCETYDKEWEAKNEIDWNQAEALTDLIKRIKNYPPHTKAVAREITQHMGLIEWDSGEVANWPALLLAALKQDKITITAELIEEFKIYDPTQPETMQFKKIECEPSKLEETLKKTLKVASHEGCELSEPKKGSWLFKVRGKEYQITKTFT